tara:strand:- start:325 stop:1008 length:684 start_codon:yes stop_codon:yes gene_type:complete
MLGLGSGLVTSGAPSEFLPSNISSLIHWYKHASGLEDAGGAFPDDDEKITTWRDNKGSNDGTTNAYDMLWDDTNKAIVSPNYGGFVLADELTFAGAFSIYFRVQYLETPGATDYFSQDLSNAGGMFISVRSPTLFRARIDSTNRDFSPPTLGTGQYYNFGLERDSSNNLRLYIDGTESSTGARTDTSAVIFDLMRCSTNDLYVTTLIFDDALSSDDRAAMETYLSNI